MKYSLESKIYTQESLQEKCKEWKNDQNVLVFTNGCFDILHEGHVRYLSEAKTLGNKLIVALNADASVRKLKGAGRPINLQNSRAIVLAGLESVDAIVVFYEETPFELISKILPNVLVKGGDWKVEQIIGSDVVLNTGGKVYS
ncbi:MAG: adenylyltransferase/cytidyltransferase family protein, partial [Saprospiraceae bacterium]